MKKNNKTFIEDSIILLFISISIYAIYSFILSSDENFTITTKEKIQEDTRYEAQKQKDDTKKEKNVLENIAKAKVFLGLKEDIDVEEEKQEENSFSTEKIDEKNIITIKDKKYTNYTFNKRYTNVNSFYEDIQENIYSNIQSSVDKSNIPAQSVKIRITILKDGNYEQLKFMGGNKQYFNAIKSSILEIFPVKIDKNIINKFPRYFRMTVKY
ncbi:MAG: hypothetical protein CSA86_05625 [Arcobacter sp.]|nr:MAG: hypothetical protein CSA86_05625 [Arcobacter sp.]